MTPLQKKLLDNTGIDEHSLNEAVNLATEQGGTIPLNLLRNGELTEDALLEFLVREFDFSAVLQFEMEDLPASVIDLVPRRLAETYRAIPVNKSRSKIEVIFSDPTDERGIRQIAQATDRDVVVRVAAESVISWALLKYYKIVTPSLTSASVHRSKTPAPRSEPEDDGRISFAIIEADESDADSGPEPGDWDAPFDLSRTLARKQKAASEEPEPTPAREMATTKREVPLEDVIDEEQEEHLDIPVEQEEYDEEDSVEVEFDDEADDDDVPLLLVDEDDWEESGSALEDAIEEDAVTWEGPIIDEREEPTMPIVMTRNVILGSKTKGDIIPPQPMTKRKAVEEIIQHQVSTERVKKETKPETPEAKEAPPSKAKEASLDPEAVERWSEGVQSLETRDEVLSSALAFMDRIFGPAVFLARKGKALGGWNCSAGFESGLQGDIHDILVVPPVPREVWHALERKRGMMGPIASRTEYAFLEHVLDEKKPSLLVLPVVIRNISAGAFVCVLRDVWKHSPVLRDTLETLGKVLSEKLEHILKKKKKT
jgi:hypothetical protein